MRVHGFLQLLMRCLVTHPRQSSAGRLHQRLSISALEAYAGQQSEAVVKADAASEKQHECINADAQTSLALASATVANGMLFWSASTDPQVLRALWQKVDSTAATRFADEASSISIGKALGF